VHEWAFATQTFQKMLGNALSATGVDDDFVARGFSNVGAWIIGRNTFGRREAMRTRSRRLTLSAVLRQMDLSIENRGRYLTAGQALIQIVVAVTQSIRLMGTGQTAT
jgi:hypothetical protein